MKTNAAIADKFEGGSPFIQSGISIGDIVCEMSREEENLQNF